MKSIPTRTCIGCRRRAIATELVRLVAVNGVLRPGPRGGVPGRGASIHPREACVAVAVERRAFARAFRAPVFPIPPGPGQDARADADAIVALVRDLEVAQISRQPKSR